jgi:uncharacterized protein YdhG (YjbR/CyaY superfamily)
MAHMKKSKASTRGTKAKGKAGPRNFAEYFAKVPKPARAALIKMRAAIESSLPRDATRTISYRIPAYKHKEKVIVWFAAFSDHCSLFPTAAVIEEFKNELKGYSTSKGTIHFPIEKPLPIALIRKLIQARVKLAESKSR